MGEQVSCSRRKWLTSKRGSYNTDFKLEVLYRQEREQLSCRQVAVLYDIRNPIKLPSGEKNLTLVVYQRLRINAGGVLK